MQERRDPQRALCRGKISEGHVACLFHTLSLLERFESATVRMMKANFALVSLRDDSRFERISPKWTGFN